MAAYSFYVVTVKNIKKYEVTQQLINKDNVKYFVDFFLEKNNRANPTYQISLHVGFD